MTDYQPQEEKVYTGSEPAENELLKKCEGEKKTLEKTGIGLIIFWFIVGFVLGALIF